MVLRMVFLWTMIAAFVASAAIGIFAILMPNTVETERLLVTSLLVGAFSLLGMICAFVMDKRRLDRPLFFLMWGGIIVSLLALGGWLLLVWIDRLWYDHDGYVKFSAIMTFFSCWSTHFGMLAMLPLTRPAGRIARVVTIVCTSLLVITLTGIVLTEEGDDAVFRFIGVLSILGACGTIVAPILAVVEWLQTRGTQESMPSAFHITMQCPRCGSDEQLRTGISTCSSCGLRIEINVQEPRCDGCGYLLYRLEGDHCPECGRSIQRENRWAAAQKHHPPPPEEDEVSGRVTSDESDSPAT